MAYYQLPYFSGHPVSIGDYRRLMMVDANNSTRSHAVRAPVDGDSQETAPGGAGEVSEVKFAVELAKFYNNNIPETAMMKVSSAIGMGIRGAGFSPAAAGNCATDRYPHNMDPGAYNRFASTADTGYLMQMQPNLHACAAALTEVPRTTIEFVKRLGCRYHGLFPKLEADQTKLGIYAQMSVCATGDFAIASSGNPNVTQTDTATHIADIYTDSNGFFHLEALFQFDVPPGQPNLTTMYPQVQYRTTDADPLEVGVGWFSGGDTRGVATPSWSKGGVETDIQFTDRANLAGFLTAYDPDMIILRCGVNDAMEPDSAATFKAAVLAKIAAYLAIKPTLIFVLVAEVDFYNTAMTAGIRTAFDAYADQLHSIAQTAANRAVFLNLRRYCQDLDGWKYPSTAFSAYMTDETPAFVHYSTAGARVEGKRLAELTMLAAKPPARGRDRALAR